MKGILKKIIAYTVVIAEPEMVILFGSMADGRANRFSDVDLLVITENTSYKEYINEKIVCFASELSLKIDVLIHSKTEIERKCLEPNSFISAVIKSGKVVYKSLHYA